MSNASDFVNLTDEFARIDGLPFEDEPTDWHLNDGLAIAAKEESREAYVFQRADASPEWIAVIINIRPEQWEFDQVLRFDETMQMEFLDAKPQIIDSADTKDELTNEQ